jgi:N-glycosylase/DNA lyase
MALNENELLSYYEKMNNELQNINHILKSEKDEKKVKLLSSLSDNLNTVLLKLNTIKMLNEKLK